MGSRRSTQKRTKVVVLEPVLAVAHEVDVPGRDGLEVGEQRLALRDARREGERRRPEDHFGMSREVRAGSVQCPTQTPPPRGMPEPPAGPLLMAILRRPTNSANAEQGPRARGYKSAPGDRAGFLHLPPSLSDCKIANMSVNERTYIMIKVRRAGFWEGGEEG